MILSFYSGIAQLKSTLDLPKDTSFFPAIRNEIEVQNIFLNLDSDDVAAYFKRALLYYQLGEFNTCVSEQNKILKRFPQHASDAYSNRGMCYCDLKQYSLALEDLTRAKALAPDDPMSYLNLAYAKAEIKDYKGSIAHLDTAILLNPGYAKAYVNRGVAKGESKDYEGAIKDLDKALEIDPYYMEAYLNRAYDHFHANHFDLAIADFNKALALQPLLHCSGFYWNRAKAFEKKGDIMNAKLDYDLAKSLERK
ncbi:MAG: tetratricopeptide repeat protein [Chitinophagaceae bacterium]|nr:tetratricopeptide repeat protein [Chitinophagaceae bacterium]